MHKDASLAYRLQRANVSSLICVVAVAHCNAWLYECQLEFTDDLELIRFYGIHAVIVTVKYPVAISSAVEHFGRIWMRFIPISLSVICQTNRQTANPFLHRPFPFLPD